MRYIFDDYNYVIKLERGEKIIASLTEFVKEKQLKAAWISGLGGAQWAELGFYNFDEQLYVWKRFDENLEITSIQGNVSWMNDQPSLHIHGTFANSTYQAIGGHVKEVGISVTCEIHLHTIFNKQLHRSFDPVTGANLLSI